MQFLPRPCAYYGRHFLYSLDHASLRADFMLTAGLAHFSGWSGHRSKGELARFLISGVWLIFLELTCCEYRVSQTVPCESCNPSHPLAIGLSMIALAGLIYLPCAFSRP